MPTITELSLVRNPKSTSSMAPESLRTEYIRSTTHLLELVDEWAQRDEPVSYREFEQALRLAVAGLARAAIALFLALREAKLSPGWASHTARGERRFRKAPAQGRSLSTWFGVVYYVRTYFREITAAKHRHGFYPLDESLGLSADRISWNVLSFAVLLALKLSFSEARKTLSECIPQPPSTEVIEQTVLGLGHHTAAWVEEAPIPMDAGDVLVRERLPRTLRQGLGHLLDPLRTSLVTEVALKLLRDRPRLLENVDALHLYSLPDERHVELVGSHTRSQRNSNWTLVVA